MIKVLVLFHSSQGSVRAMAQTIAEAIISQGAEPVLRTFTQQLESDIVVSLDDLKQCHALAFGSPTRFGMMAHQAKQFWETTSDLWLRGTLIDKPAAVFCSSSSMHGGNEATLLNLSLPLLHHGMLLLGVPYDIPELSSTKSGGTPYGASHVSGLTAETKLTPEEIQICRAVGARLVTIARKMQ
ncbi:NAD(P)H-dependent oxidoreductase [Pseudoalteromonas xiamenensis]|uniref:Transcriptional regulator n=1 Tax=Pseudoalteromonas xiamenensis TaxID=882626 RepID=A0A975DI05_9GAMM|nr:NAD(P)H-dependent oxidoreductase [Pseudoalteromonas xiamenensis]QTH71984.1 transcriptional regulator [Pseudoalteromonas xiamenensis]